MSDPNHPGLSDSGADAIAYITFLPAVVFLFLPPYNARFFVRFHCWQSIFLIIVSFVIDVVVGTILGIAVPRLPAGFFGLHLIWPAIDVAWLAIWLLCAVKAINGRLFKLPIIGNLAERMANK
ncbi:MAG: hypothetical protein ABR912_15170 [Terracidiphilus sp.]|jgi:uncharacterized membrane protein